RKFTRQLSEALRQILCQQIELGRDLRSKHPTDRYQRTEQRDNNGHDRPRFRQPGYSAELANDRAWSAHLRRERAPSEALVSFPRAHRGPLPLNFISRLRIFRRGQVRETSISLNCTRVVPALAKVIASIRLWSRRHATSG